MAAGRRKHGWKRIFAKVEEEEELVVNAGRCLGEHV